MKTLHRFLAPLLLVAILVLPGVAPAQAAVAQTSSVQAPFSSVSNPDVGGSSGSSRVGRCGAGQSVTTMVASENLTDTRWLNAVSGLHSRLDTSVGLGVDAGFDGNSISRDMVAGTAMSAASGLWGWTSSLVAGSVSFCAPQAVFYKIDQAAGKIGQMVMGGKINGVPTPSLMGLFLALTLIGAFVVAIRRHNFPLKTVVSKIVAASVLAVMIAGANGSKLDSRENYTPGVFSPGWIVTKLTDTVNAVGSAPGAALGTALSATTQEGVENSWCAGYTQAMHQRYQKDKGGTGSAGWPIPLTMSEMWSSTGGKSWSDAQYGVAGSNSKLAENTWCMHLDLRLVGPSFMEAKDASSPAGIDATSPILGQAWNASSAAYKSTMNAYEKGSMAFRASSVEEIDKSVIAWATCEPIGLKSGGLKALASRDLSKAENWTIRKGTRADHVVTAEEAKSSGKTESDKLAAAITSEACARWYSGEDKDLAAFNWPTNKKDIIDHNTKVGGSADMEAFVLYLHGEANQASITAAFAYLFSAFIMLIVFGLMSVGIFIAQIAMIFGSLALILAAIIWAVPFTTQGPKSMMKALKGLMGLSLVSLVVVGLFTFITLITRVIHTLGAEIGGSVFQSIWTGLSPVIAILVLHLLFTKGLKMPSPFTLSGATAWGKTLGGEGGAAGLSGISSLSQRADSMRRGLTERGLERIPGVSSGRDMLHRAGITKTGSRRGAQLAKDPEARLAKATANEVAKTFGVDPEAAGGRRKGNNSPLLAAVPGSLPENQNTDSSSSSTNRVQGLLGGGQLDEHDLLIDTPVTDDDEDLSHLAPGQDPAAAAAQAAEAAAEFAREAERLESEHAGSIDDRANLFQVNPGSGASDAQKLAALQEEEQGRNLLANVHRTDVANSELGEAAVGSKSKRIAEKVAAIERREAAKWTKDELRAQKLHRKAERAAGRDPETGEELSDREKPSVRNKVMDLMAAPWQGMRDRPVRTIARNVALGTAATVTIAAVAPAAVLAAPLAALAPTAINAGRRRKAAYQKARSVRQELKTAEGQDALVQRYREHLQAEDLAVTAEKERLMARQRTAQGFQKQSEEAVVGERKAAAEALKLREQAVSQRNNNSRGQSEAAVIPATSAEASGQNRSRRQAQQSEGGRQAPSAVSPVAQVQPATQAPSSRPRGTEPGRRAASPAGSANSRPGAASLQPSGSPSAAVPAGRSTADSRQAASGAPRQGFADRAAAPRQASGAQGAPVTQATRSTPPVATNAQPPAPAPQQRQAPAPQQPVRQAPAPQQPVRQAPAPQQPVRQAPAPQQPARQAPAMQQPAPERRAPSPLGSPAPPPMQMRPASTQAPSLGNPERRNTPGRKE